MSEIRFAPLARLTDAYGARLAEFAFEPGFVAAVDQHVAELRERLRGPWSELEADAPDPEDLSDYALGFLDALEEIGWQEPVGHDYAVCRLTAVCWLVREHRLLEPDAH
ncbi:DUF6401 family natural product biosynthesis protein [Streptacidiphilus melanogenes]|uniref:DUF6401 family natural product biosynthesis protein n=1 Tax=Streptacidiphilus melanogenes TaxID=411235 RepID=UPI0005A94845|nr:DUF6401 family natural product biosynthesis protein [Streptacidiphilus melanogenes]